MEIKELGLHVCGECGYIGNTGLWEGSANVRGKKTTFSELAKYNPFDNTFHLIDFELEKNLLSQCGGFDGRANCPICKSPNFFIMDVG